MSSVVIPPPDRIQADVEYLKEWIAKEPHLPSIDDEEWLKSFLYNNKFSLEKTKYKLDNYYSLRTKYQEYITNRDPTAADLTQLGQQFRYCESHNSLKDQSQVHYYKLGGDPATFNVTAYVKRLLMAWDHSYLDPENRLINTISIHDFSDIKPMHLLKVSTVMNVITDFTEKAYTFRIKAIHFINIPSYVHKFVEVIVKAMPAKMVDRIHIHKTTETLLEMIDEGLLSSDFGGKDSSLDDLADQTTKKLVELRDWFKSQESVHSDESLRRRDHNQPEEMRGSFRKMDVD